MNIILGYGRTGRALAHFFQNTNKDFTIFDENPQSLSQTDFPKNIIHEIPKSSLEIERIIVSPGISTQYSRSQNSTNNFITFAEENAIPMVSDIELFMKLFPKKEYLGITGTNGKSTTTTLLNHILQKCGLNSALCGNIGVSPFENAINSEICAVEISNAQIELTHNIQFDISAITNLSPDHLDRYPSVELYYKMKLEIASLSKTLIVNQSILENFTIEHKNVIPFSIETQCDGYYIYNNKIFFKGLEICQLPKIQLLGKHNLENILCAFAVCHQFGCDVEKSVNAISEFQGISHRLQHIATKNGVKFFNDSKATNLDSTLNALRAFNLPVFLIAGGKLVEDISGIFAKEEFANVETVGIVGACSAIIAKEIHKHNEKNPSKKIKYILCGDIKKATEMLYIEAQKIQNSSILLSPFCKSFDQFKDFEHRGDYFCKVVENL